MSRRTSAVGGGEGANSPYASAAAGVSLPMGNGGSHTTPSQPWARAAANNSTAWSTPASPSPYASIYAAGQGDSAAASPSSSATDSKTMAAAASLARMPWTAAGQQQTPSAQSSSRPAVPQWSTTSSSAGIWGAGPTPQTPGQQQNNASTDHPIESRDVLDVLGGSGIDLRAEEEAMRARVSMAAQGYLRDTGSDQGMHPTASLPYLQLFPLASAVHAITSEHELSVDPEVLSTLSIAARIRFKNLLEAMVEASRHRCWSSHQRPPPTHEEDSDANEAEPSSGPSKRKAAKKPMYQEELLSDPSKWLAAIEKADRGEEVRARKKRAQRQKEALLAAAAAPGSGSSGVDPDGDESMAGEGSSAAGGDGPSEKKKAKKPPSARNVSEDVRRRLANNTAARALGGPATPKWMMGGAAASQAFVTPTKDKGFGNDDPDGSGSVSSLPKPRFAPPAATGSSGGWGRALAPSGLSGSPLNASSGKNSVNPDGWGDLAQRALAKEEEERRKRKRVLVSDALHALDMERKTGAGRGSGEKTAWRWRNGVRPNVASNAGAEGGGANEGS